MKQPRTSRTHPLQIATIKVDEVIPDVLASAMLGITFCPGKVQPDGATGSWSRDLDADLDAIRAWGATPAGPAIVVTLIEHHELDALKVSRLGKAVRERGMEWVHLPFPDGSAPGDRFETMWSEHGQALRRALRGGRSVLVHCKGGQGRAGTIAARLLVELGREPAAAVQDVRAARSGAIENEMQRQHVLAAQSVED